MVHLSEIIMHNDSRDKTECRAHRATLMTQYTIPEVPQGDSAPFSYNAETTQRLEAYRPEACAPRHATAH